MGKSSCTDWRTAAMPSERTNSQVLVAYSQCLLPEITVELLQKPKHFRLCTKPLNFSSFSKLKYICILKEGSNSWEKAAALIGILLQCHPSAQTCKCLWHTHNFYLLKLPLSFFRNQTILGFAQSL